MSLEDEIAGAIHSHEQWKVRLAAAIQADTIEDDVAEVGRDDICAFGRWLNGWTIPNDARYDPNYIIVHFLHSKFHECAGNVVRLLSEGKTAEASALMASDGEYTRISDQLVATMMKWMDSIEQTRARRA